MAPIRTIFEKFVDCCQKAYTPNEYMTIDEMLFAFRGRCGFRVYILSKPAKYGIKVQALVDAKSFYTVNLEVYAGKQPTGPYFVSNKAYDVVDRLVQPISCTNRNITFDNWFTSYELVVHLLNEHKLTSTGTVRNNKRCIPAAFLKTGKAPGSSMFGHQKDVSMVSYAPKKHKVVIVMSSLHHDAKIDSATGNQKKPEMITFYNSTKAGVDVVDELCGSYNVSRNSKRWPMIIYYGMLNIAAINATIIFRENQSKDTKRTDFIRNLGLALVYEHLKMRKDQKNIPIYIRQRISSQINEPLPTPTQNAPGRYIRCGDCPNKKDRKTKYSCASCQKAICMEHATFFCKNCADFNSSS
ncbi:piggyBac transposable element-derived protein 3-like [Vanessa atalanta]|uniref:piggyBac transposable element-derived protein 3-like n=1 Tax=Vanessa atalanta TaxID=42275 RepID=UPI001FCDB2BB|nr:piggyBac transposable element-derived protein 3-like [Vanessa atalanta]